MFWRKINSTFAFLVLLSFGVQTSFAHQYEETLDRTFALKPGGELILINTNGKVTVRAWDQEKLRLRAELRVEAQNREEARKIAEEAIAIDQTPEQIQIETKREKVISLWKSLFGKKKRSKVCRVDYELTLPRRTDLDIRSVNGGIGITDIEGGIEARTTNGGIGISGVSSSVNAHTTNGGIKVELNEVSPDESMSFTTTNGGIKVCLPQTIKADISARTTNGRIHTDLPLEVKGSFNSRNIKGKINGGGALVKLNTTNGGISILSVSEKGDKH